MTPLATHFNFSDYSDQMASFSATVGSCFNVMERLAAKESDIHSLLALYSQKRAKREWISDFEHNSEWTVMLLLKYLMCN